MEIKALCIDNLRRLGDEGAIEFKADLLGIKGEQYYDSEKEYLGNATFYYSSWSNYWSIVITFENEYQEESFPYKKTEVKLKGVTNIEIGHDIAPSVIGVITNLIIGCAKDALTQLPENFFEEEVLVFSELREKYN